MKSIIPFVFILWLFPFFSSAQEVKTPAEPQPIKSFKAFIFPGIYANNISVGAEWQSGERRSWSTVLSGTAGIFGDYGSYHRIAYRFGHRIYLLKLDEMRNGKFHINPFAVGFVGTSYHSEEGIGDEPGFDRFRSVHVGVGIGQQVFFHNAAFDLAFGMRLHRGQWQYGWNGLGSFTTDWQYRTWLSPMFHAQLGILLDTKRRK